MFLCLTCAFDLPQDEDHAGLYRVPQVVRDACNRIEPARGIRQFLLVLLHVFHQINLEIVEGKVGDGYAAGDILQIHHFVLEFLELFLPILKVVHLFGSLLVDDIFLARRRHIQQYHAPLHPFGKIDVSIQILRRPEVHQLYHRILGAYAVNSPETLDNPHRIPVYIVVHQIVTILEVLPFRNAVRGYEYINFIRYIREDMFPIL